MLVKLWAFDLLTLSGNTFRGTGSYVQLFNMSQYLEQVMQGTITHCIQVYHFPVIFHGNK